MQLAHNQKSSSYKRSPEADKSLTMTSQKNTLLVSTRKGLIIYKYDGTTWNFDSNHFEGIPVTLTYVDKRTNTWWACLDHGHWGCKLSKSTDEGKTWTEIVAPKYPEGEEARKDKPANLKLLWAFADGADKTDHLYIGTEPGGLFVSKDNGASFELNRGLWDQPKRKELWFGGGRDNAAIHSIIVDPRDSNHIYLAISCAGVFETTDGGETWAPKNKGLKADFLPDPNSEIGQDPHYLVACPSNPDYMWQQNHCGIFKTEDGGANWEDVSQKSGPANFGFAIAVHEENPDMAWVVPGVSDGNRIAVDKAMCVCRTDDGGKTWTDFRSGLPQEVCFDITYRHALDITGETLCFGTTTGNLFLSDDLGENWATISNFLPMVHAVKFV